MAKKPATPRPAPKAKSKPPQAAGGRGKQRKVK